MSVVAVRRCVVICTMIDLRLNQEIIRDMSSINVFGKSSSKSMADDIDGEESSELGKKYPHSS